MSMIFSDTRRPSRPACRAAALLTLLALLLIWGISSSLALPRTAPGSGYNDRDLYEEIVGAVAKGQSYYTAAPAAMRVHGYPLKPFLTVRPPELATGLALLPSPTARKAALRMLALLTFGAWAWRLRRVWSAEPVRYTAALVLIGSGIYPVLSESTYLFHEVWAGLLMSVSLALYRPGAFGVSLAIGLAAALLRELAIPFLAAMALAGWFEGRKTEAVAWILAAALAMVALIAHGSIVIGMNQATDLRSPGWVGLGGWNFVLSSINTDMFLLSAPKWCVAVAFPLALVGLLLPSGGAGLRVALTTCGFVAGLCVFGRPENLYWGLMIGPVWPLGLAWTDAALKRLVEQSRPLFTPGQAGAGAPRSFPPGVLSSFKDF